MTAFGYIYWARCATTGLVKIGSTSNLRRRLYQLGWKYKTRLSLIRKVQSRNKIFDERTVQICAEKYRVRGEWFQLSDEQVERLIIHLREYQSFRCRCRQRLKRGWWARKIPSAVYFKLP